MDEYESRPLDLAYEIVEYAESNGYTTDELLTASMVIGELLAVVAKLRHLVSLVYEDGECDIEGETIEKVIREAEEVINDVD